MNVAVFGTGYVGLVTGTCFADFGVNVTCVDADADKINAIERGRIPFYEPGLETMVAKNVREKRLSFTTEAARTVRDAEIIFIAVGTPQTPEGGADLRAVEQVARCIGQNLSRYTVIVTKSTVPAGTNQRIRDIVSEHAGPDAHFDVVANPEFLREGSAIDDFLHPDRIVIGTDSERAVALLTDLYSPLRLAETPFVITDVVSAEVIKYASNAFLAVKVSFINELALLCEKMNADVQQVAKGMGLDSRINPKFLQPGPGYGGSCLPKDVSAFADMARKNGHTLHLVEAVAEVNRRQKASAVEKIMDALSGVTSPLVAVAGLSFKPETDDVREAPALEIIRALHERGIRCRAYDPAAIENARAILPDIEYATDVHALVEGADCLVFVTEWNAFRKLNLEKIKSGMRSPVIVDLRNIYDPEQVAAAGFTYHSVGRRRAAPQAQPIS